MIDGKRFQCNTLEVALFDNTDSVCCNCSTFGPTYIYCPIFDLIMRDNNVPFDETGELNGCELFKKKTLSWICKICGENEHPQCHKCIREDGKMVTDELMRGE